VFSYFRAAALFTTEFPTQVSSKSLKPIGSNCRSPDKRLLGRHLIAGVSRYGQNRAFGISDYSLSSAAAQRIQKTVMTLRRHHDEICAVFVRRLKNLSLDVPPFAELPPLPQLPPRYDDFREAAFFADMKQREDHPMTIECVGQ
jgi:hypothetical protein